MFFFMDNVYAFGFFFFFSSRRRHTRSLCDWSSDVCSSDLTTCDGDGRPTGLTASAFTSVSLEPPLILICVAHKSQSYPCIVERGRFAVNFLRREQEEIGRASCRERVEVAVDGGIVKRERHE